MRKSRVRIRKSPHCLIESHLSGGPSCWLDQIDNHVIEYINRLVQAPTFHEFAVLPKKTRVEVTRNVTEEGNSTFPWYVARFTYAIVMPGMGRFEGKDERRGSKQLVDKKHPIEKMKATHIVPMKWAFEIRERELFARGKAHVPFPITIFGHPGAGLLAHDCLMPLGTLPEPIIPYIDGDMYDLIWGKSDLIGRDVRVESRIGYESDVLDWRNKFVRSLLRSSSPSD